MAKTTIKTYFTGGTGLDNIIRVDGSAEQCQKYVKGKRQQHFLAEITKYNLRSID